MGGPKGREEEREEEEEELQANLPMTIQAYSSLPPSLPPSLPLPPGVFDPFMGPYIELEKRNMEEMLEKALAEDQVDR